MMSGRVSFRFDDPKWQTSADWERSEVLESCSQEWLFGHILQQPILPERRYRNPLRLDMNPGCKLIFLGNTLYFCDFAYKPTHMDAFELHRRLAGLLTYEDSVRDLHTMLLAGALDRLQHPVQEFHGESRRSLRHDGAQLLVQVRPYTPADSKYWGQFGITWEQLARDAVYPVHRYSLNGKLSPRLTKLCYAYTHFEDGRMKLYFPHGHDSQRRFISTCRRDDVGAVQSEPHPVLTITKSYKDARVLANAGLRVIWVQNEGCLPAPNAILPHVGEGCTGVQVLFDNDRQGVEASAKMLSHLSRFVELPLRRCFTPSANGGRHTKDFADLRASTSQKDFTEYIKCMRGCG